MPWQVAWRLANISEDLVTNILNHLFVPGARNAINCSLNGFKCCLAYFYG